MTGSAPRPGSRSGWRLATAGGGARRLRSSEDGRTFLTRSLWVLSCAAAASWSEADSCRLTVSLHGRPTSVVIAAPRHHARGRAGARGPRSKRVTAGLDRLGRELTVCCSQFISESTVSTDLCRHNMIYARYTFYPAILLVVSRHRVVRFRVWNTSSHVILTADYINTAVFCIHNMTMDS
eukprot:COSAG06_NODE_25239_length_641_cov_2.140221_1_plen_179_part_10